MSKVFQNDLGTVLTIDTGTALAAATTTELHVLKPDGSTAEWTADSVSGDAMIYTTVAGDWADLGTYRLVAYLEFGGGTSKFTGTAFEIEVHKKYKDIGK